MAELFQDPEFKSIRHVNDELFAVEQLCRQYGFEDVRQALYRVRVHEVGGRETAIRGRVRRENEASSLPRVQSFPLTEEQERFLNGGVKDAPAQRGVEDLLRELRNMRDHLAPHHGGDSLRSDFNAACDRLDVLASKLAHKDGVLVDGHQTFSQETPVNSRGIPSDADTRGKG